MKLPTISLGLTGKIAKYPARSRNQSDCKIKRIPPARKLTIVLSLAEQISMGNRVISSAIWDKSAQVNFSKTNKIARACRASAVCGL